MPNEFAPSLEDLARQRPASWLERLMRAPHMPAAWHDALAAVRSRGAYYGGAPQVPGPAVRPPMIAPAEPPMFIRPEGKGPIRSVGGTPTWAGEQKFPSAMQANENLEPESRIAGLLNLGRLEDKKRVLAKLIAKRDFRPVLAPQGGMYFRSLTPGENEIMSQIGWARAPNVTHADETSSDPLTSLRAWERNIRHWLNLAGPPKGK